MSQPNRREPREIKAPVQMFGPGQRPGDVDYTPHVLDSKDPLDPAALQGGVEVPKASSALEAATSTPSTEDGSIPEPPDLTVPVDEGPPQPISDLPGPTTTLTTTTNSDPSHPSTSQQKTSRGSASDSAPTVSSSQTRTSSTPPAPK